MPEVRTTRRLAAILAADVVGYSRLMESDEAGTLAALKEHRERVFGPAVAANGGGIVKFIGDGALVTFGSAFDAVNCALAIQKANGGDHQAGPRITLRIGVNLGDVIIDGDDIYGDGVNIAARLEPLADPGGICISSIVNETIGGRIDAHFEDGGEVELKNIDRPIRVWMWRPENVEAGPAAHAKAAEPIYLPTMAVLPFENMSGDPTQEYFADGIVEDLITSLSRFRSFAVIARNSSFVFKGHAVDVRQASQRLGARYILEGSVRRAGTRLRVTAQLVDGTTGAHLWAQNFDGVAAEVFDMQDRITENVVAVVEPRIRQAEIARSRRERPESLDAYDLYLRACYFLGTWRAEDNAKAIRLLEQAIALEPGYTTAVAHAANAYEHRISVGWAPIGANDRERGLELARSALALAPDDPTQLARCGLVLIMLGREYDQGNLILRRGVEGNPNNVTALLHAGIGQLIGGDLDEALRYLHRTVGLTPGDSLAAMTGVGHVLFCLGRHEEALDWASRSLAEHASFAVTHWVLIAANAHLGRQEEARRSLARLQALIPDVRIAHVKGVHHTKDPRRADLLIAGLRIAGMPE